MIFQKIITKNGQDLIWFHQGQYHAWNYKRAELPPHVVHALLEDRQFSTIPGTMFLRSETIKVSNEEFSDLVEYTPGKSRIDKIRAIQEKKERPIATRDVWAESIGSDAYNDWLHSMNGNIASIPRDSKIFSLIELKKGFDAWLASITPKELPGADKTHGATPQRMVIK